MALRCCNRVHCLSVVLGKARRPFSVSAILIWDTYVFFPKSSLPSRIIFFISVYETYIFILIIMPIVLYSYLLLYNTILVYGYATLMNIPAFAELLYLQYFLYAFLHWILKFSCVFDWYIPLELSIPNS